MEGQRVKIISSEIPEAFGTVIAQSNGLVFVKIESFKLGDRFVSADILEAVEKTNTFIVDIDEVICVH